MHTQPSVDDVIVVHKPGRKVAPWALRTTAGRDQLLFTTRDAAVAHAMAFAQIAQVATWIDDSQAGLVLLGSCRTERIPAPAPVVSDPGARERVEHRVSRVAPNVQS